jgi:integrase
LRADELRRADVGDIRTGTDGAAVIHVRGKGCKDRAVPIETDLLSVIEDYLDSRTSRLPATLKSSPGKGLHDGQRTRRCSLAVTASASPAAPLDGATNSALIRAGTVELPSALDRSVAHRTCRQISRTSLSGHGNALQVLPLCSQWLHGPDSPC